MEIMVKELDVQREPGEICGALSAEDRMFGPSGLHHLHQFITIPNIPGDICFVQ